MGTTLSPIPEKITNRHVKNKRLRLQNFIMSFEVGQEFSSNQASNAADLGGAGCAMGHLKQRDDVQSIGRGMWRRVK